MNPRVSSHDEMARAEAIPMVIIRPLTSPSAIFTSTARSLNEGRIATIRVSRRIMKMARIDWNL